MICNSKLGGIWMFIAGIKKVFDAFQYTPTKADMGHRKISHNIKKYKYFISKSIDLNILFSSCTLNTHKKIQKNKINRSHFQPHFTKHTHTHTFISIEVK